MLLFELIRNNFRLVVIVIVIIHLKFKSIIITIFKELNSYQFIFSYYIKE
jgi:hypothetical protein